MLLKSLNPTSRQQREVNKRIISNTLVFFLKKRTYPSVLIAFRRLSYDPFSSVYKFALSLLKVLLLILIIKNKKMKAKARTAFFKKEPHFLIDQPRTRHIFMLCCTKSIYLLTNLGTSLVGRLYFCETEIDFI